MTQSVRSDALKQQLSDAEQAISRLNVLIFKADEPDCTDFDRRMLVDESIEEIAACLSSLHRVCADLANRSAQ